MVDDESIDSSTEGSVSVVTDVSAVHNDKTRPLFCKMKTDDNSCTPLLSCRTAESMGLVTVNYNAFDVCTV